MPPIFWTQKQDIGPSARAKHGLAYDSARQRVLLFGGDPGGDPLADTWAWDSALWTQVADTGPSARHSTALADESSRQRVLLFGGAAGNAALGDTWISVDMDWTQVADTGPQARSGHAMAFDPNRDRVVLFGGAAGNDRFGDTWEWDGTEWTQVQDTGPSARSGHALAFDAVGSRIVLFGGAAADGAGLNDTWSWDGTTWSQIADIGPEPRTGLAMAGIGGVLLFGGIDTVEAGQNVNRTVYGDSWRLDGSLWTRVQDIGPAARWGHAVAFRADATRVVLVGGATSFAPAQDSGLAVAVRGDTWEVQAGTNQPGPDPDQPQPGQVEVASVSVQPDSVTNAGDVIDVSVQLTDSAPTLTVLTAAIFADSGGGNFMPAEPSGFTIPPVVVPAAVTSYTFQIVRDTQPLSPGPYAIGVGVEGGASMQGGFFTVN